jgi:hypothetical protein
MWQGKLHQLTPIFNVQVGYMLIVKLERLHDF